MPPFTTRPVIMGSRGVVTSGHYLATAAGFRIMEQGGNAIDAAAAMCFCINLLEPHHNGIGGEVPTLIYSAVEKKPFAISGLGTAPQAMTIAWCREHGIDLIPGDGHLPACVPAVVGTWATALARFGTMSYAQVLQPAIELAREGFPLYDQLHETLLANREKFTERYPTTGRIYLPGGEVPEVGDRIRNPDWAHTLETMCRAEQETRGRGRVAGIEAACTAFYRGPIAERMVTFAQSHPLEDASGEEHRSLLTMEDLAAWQARVEEPASTTYRGHEVHKCSTWTQGPVFLQQLNLLEGFDLAAMGHNRSDYLHTLIECSKLAFADREAYYGDPDFDDVPIDVLLSKSYANRRRALVDDTASLAMRPGDVGAGPPPFDTADVVADNRLAMQVAPREIRDLGQSHAHLGDTTHLDAADGQGNMVAATPSGGWLGTSPVIEGLGFPMGTRGQMFYLNPDRPNALGPRKRPRATLTPTLVTRHGVPHMVFGTPGGDSQDQWTLQFYLNCVDFNMTLAEALDAPTVHSTHFPSSFYPRDAYPGQVIAEQRIPRETIAELQDRGHEIRTVGPWEHGKVMGIRFDPERRLLEGAASAKGGIGYALGW